MFRWHEVSAKGCVDSSIPIKERLEHGGGVTQYTFVRGGSALSAREWSGWAPIFPQYISLSDLAHALQTKFYSLFHISNIDQAISFHAIDVEVQRPESLPIRPTFLSNLAHALPTLFVKTIECMPLKRLAVELQSMEHGHIHFIGLAPYSPLGRKHQAERILYSLHLSFDIKIQGLTSSNWKASYSESR